MLKRHHVVSDENQPDIICAFNSTSSYLDDLFNIHNVCFEKHGDQIYPTEHQLTLSMPNFRRHLPSVFFCCCFLNNLSAENKFICKVERLSKSVDPDETTHYELSHLDLHCLQKACYHRLWQ